MSARARLEHRLERLLFHVILVFGGLRDLLEQIDIERGLVRRDLAGQKHGAQHQVLHVETLFLAGRDVVPRHVARDLGLVCDALLVEYAERAHLAGAPHFEILRRIIDVRRNLVADELGRRLAARRIGR